MDQIAYRVLQYRRHNVRGISRFPSHSLPGTGHEINRYKINQGKKSTKELRNEVNPGIKSTQEENQPEHEINQGGKEINQKK